MKIITIRIALSFFALTLIGVESQSQPYHFPPTKESQLILEIMKPNLERSSGIKTISSVWFLNGSFPIGSRGFVAMIELPVSYFDIDDNSNPFFSFQYDSEVLIGNMLLGLEVRGDNRLDGGYGQLLVRLPLAEEKKDDAALYGLLTDFDRIEAFTPNQVSLLGGGGYRHKLLESESKSAQLHFGLTALAMLSTEDNVDDELFVKYFGQFWYLSNSLNLGFGLSGVTWLSEDEFEFGNRSEHNASIDMQFSLGRTRPGVFMKIPVADALEESVGFTGGVSLAVRLGN